MQEKTDNNSKWYRREEREVFKPWDPPKKQANEHAKRLMLREALHVALSVIMKNQS